MIIDTPPTSTVQADDYRSSRAYRITKQLASGFHESESAISLIRQLNRLVKAVQRHRGVSIALLAGQAGYRQEFVALQAQIERRLAVLDTKRYGETFMPESSHRRLSDAWITIKSNWEEDHVTDNFELHVHFIEDVLRTIEHIAKALDTPMDTHNTAQDRSSPSQSLLAYVCARLPQIMEQVARIRGSTAYMVATGEAHGFDQNKIRFWIASLLASNDDTATLARQLASSSEWSDLALPLIEKNHSAIPTLMQVIEAVAFSGTPNLEGAQRIFAHGSDIIDNYSRVINHGLDQILLYKAQAFDRFMETGE